MRDQHRGRHISVIEKKSGQAYSVAEKKIMVRSRQDKMLMELTRTPQLSLGMADQPALGLDGQLLDASKIIWYNDPDDDHPIQPAQHGIIFNSLVILSQRFIMQVTPPEVQHGSLQVVRDWLQLLLQRNLMNLVIFFNHIDALMLDNPAPPGPLLSTSEQLQTILVLMQMMTTSLPLPLMTHRTMMVTPTSWILVMKRYQALNLYYKYGSQMLTLCR
jgi:hypothetical protein